MKKLKCPVCGAQVPINELFCATCGFELHVLPDNVHAEVLEYENKRTEAARNRYRQAGDMSNVIKEQETRLQEQAARMEEQASQIEALNQDLEKRSAELAASKEELTNSQEAVEKANKASGELERQLEETRKELEGRKGARPVAFLSCKKGADEKIFGLYEGYNYFSGRVRGSSVQLEPNETSIALPGISLVRNHFCIVVDQAAGHIRVEAANGTVNLPTQHHNLQNGDKFFGGDAEFTIYIR